MGSNLLTTGEVARLLGVTRDAVLKWIKKGKLPATRTPGGHYRVPREACYGFARDPSGDGLATTDRPGPSPGSPTRSQAEQGEVRCWEYFGSGGVPRQACLNCLVYLARAQNCYRLAELGEEVGHSLHFCRTDCRECAFYRACQGLETEVLIVTRDEGLSHRVEKEAEANRISIRFARSGYQASATVSTFRPALVILDSDVPEVREGHLARALLADERLPGIRVYVAGRKGHEPDVETLGLPTIPAPFDGELVGRLAQGLARQSPSIVA